MAEMIALVASWFPDRKFVLVVDSLYSGKSALSWLPENFDLIGPVHPKAALDHPAPEETQRLLSNPASIHDLLEEGYETGIDLDKSWHAIHSAVDRRRPRTIIQWSIERPLSRAAGN